VTGPQPCAPGAPIPAELEALAVGPWPQRMALLNWGTMGWECWALDAVGIWRTRTFDRTTGPRCITMFHVRGHETWPEGTPPAVVLDRQHTGPFPVGA
jgi:hypothetical protein